MIRYLAIFCVAVVTSAGAVFGINAYLDTNADWSYLTTRTSKPPIDPNYNAEAKYKFAFLSSRPPGDVALGVFGNSRVTAIDVTEFNDSENGIAMNLAFGGANVDQIEVFLDTANRLHPGIVPFIGFNYDSCLHEKSTSDLYLRPFPHFPSILDSVLRLGSISSLYRGIWAKLSPRAISEVEIAKYGNNVRHFDYGDTAKIEEAVAVDRDIYLKFLKSEPREHCFAFLQHVRATYPDAVLFLNPISRYMLDWIEEVGAESNRQEFLRRIAEFGPIYDFTCAKEITDNISNYRDAHHYNGDVGRLVFSELLNAKRNMAPRHACIID